MTSSSLNSCRGTPNRLVNPKAGLCKQVIGVQNNLPAHLARVFTVYSYLQWKQSRKTSSMTVMSWSSLLRILLTPSTVFKWLTHFWRSSKSELVNTVLSNIYICHVETSILQQLKVHEKFGWEILEHTLYSPDLASIYFHQLGLLKASLGGQKFENMKNRYSSTSFVSCKGFKNCMHLGLKPCTVMGKISGNGWWLHTETTSTDIPQLLRHTYKAQYKIKF
jgi:hypothetical protein